MLAIELRPVWGHPLYFWCVCWNNLLKQKNELKIRMPNLHQDFLGSGPGLIFFYSTEGDHNIEPELWMTARREMGLSRGNIVSLEIRTLCFSLLSQHLILHLTHCKSPSHVGMEITYWRVRQKVKIKYVIDILW